MSLQRRLTKGISAVLAVILIFMVLTSMSYWDIEGFVTSILPVNITIARSYESIVGRWTQIGEIANESLKAKPSTQENDTGAQTIELEKIIGRIETLIQDPQRLESLRQIKRLCSTYISQLTSLGLLTQNRNRILRKNADLRSKAAEGVRSEGLNLLGRFKSMMHDLTTTLKNPDFQASLGGTSSLMEKISRIEKDLILSETEIALYLSLRKEKDSSGSKSDRSSSTRVESRLRAVLFLLDRSIQESKTTLHKRVLTQVENKVKSFFDSFLKLRNILEAPESDLLEIEDQIHSLLENLTELKQKGVTSAAAEAEFFWTRIFSISDDLISHASNNHRLILAFLIIVLAAGIYLKISFPRAIGGPLKNLSTEISNFTFGNKTLEIPNSGTEEIDTLGKAFQLMAERLNLQAERLNSQAEVNRSYLKSIHKLTGIYCELYATEQRADLPDERLEKAINDILQQFTDQYPKVDHAKAMLIRTNPETEEKYFIRFGEPKFSESFKLSKECATYCKSVGYPYKKLKLSKGEKIPVEKEEIVPFDMGLTGWYFENSPDIRTDADDAIFFQPFYSIPSINKNPILTDRKYEKGLNGCLWTENLNVPEEDPDEIQKPHGILFVYFHTPEVKLSWQEIFFIKIIASQIAALIETHYLLLEHDLKKLIDVQLKMAREIQDNLLPQTVPDVSGLKIGTLNKPAAEVGGDYFDFFDLGKNRLGVVIADASGKNVPAAIIMTVFKTTLSTMELEHLSAGEVLTRANRIIAKNITNDRFITAMYVIIDSATGKVELASAGHNPAFVASSQNLPLQEKIVKGLPLGILENYQYQSVSFTLSKGDLLFLYTDGVTEARDINSTEFGESGLREFLARRRGEGAEQPGKTPAQILLGVIESFSMGAKQHDDITAVSIEFTGENNEQSD